MVDVGLSGTPAAMASALAAAGFQVNADSTISVIDPTKNTSGLTVTGYRLLDGVAYVLVRTENAIPVPPGLSVVGAALRTALSGTFMSDEPPPTVISVNAFFQRLTPGEKTAIRSGLATHPTWGPAIVAAAFSDGVDLLAASTSTMLDALVSGGVLTAPRKATILTP